MLSHKLDLNMLFPFSSPEDFSVFTLVQEKQTEPLVMLGWSADEAYDTVSGNSHLYATENKNGQKSGKKDTVEEKSDQDQISTLDTIQNMSATDIRIAELENEVMQLRAAIDEVCAILGKTYTTERHADADINNQDSPQEGEFCESEYEWNQISTPDANLRIAELEAEIKHLRATIDEACAGIDDILAIQEHTDDNIDNQDSPQQGKRYVDSTSAAHSAREEDHMAKVPQPKSEPGEKVGGTADLRARKKSIWGIPWRFLKGGLRLSRLLISLTSTDMEDIGLFAHFSPNYREDFFLDWVSTKGAPYEAD
ncbi:hypothetical protein F4777DRAFT_549841 [Nemania sp. FL0916]|nr:hypothetical protein F4777DRAFT_549841 [Nemania sp. FL0916]